MRKIFVLACLVLCATMFAGCAKTPTRGEYVKMDSAPVIKPAADEGLVYFLRESAFTGGGMSYFIFEDNTKIGVLRSGSYFIHKSKAGKHTYWGETESKAMVTVNVEAGKTYYVVGGINMGFWAGRPALSEVTEPVARKMLPDLTYTRLATDQEVDEYKAKEKREEQHM